MKKIENNFTVTGFLGKDAEIREFTNSSVARFPLAVSRQERNAEETNRISAFMNIEAWRKNENTGAKIIASYVPISGTKMKYGNYLKNAGRIS